MGELTKNRSARKAEIGLKDNDAANVAEFLNELLADQTVLYTKLRHAHWNVEGIDFHAQHAFFQELYTQLFADIDEVAERVRMLGHYAVGSLAKYLELSRLSEIEYEGTDSKGLITELLGDYEAVVVHLRGGIDLAEAAGDTGSEDFLTGLLGQYEKTAWMLRAHVS